LAVSKLSFESKEKLPLALVNAKAMPLFGIEPFSQACANAVISINRNWPVLLVVTEVAFPPVADGPNGGGGVL
jgi:hypothetical protein